MGYKYGDGGREIWVPHAPWLSIACAGYYALPASLDRKTLCLAVLEIRLWERGELLKAAESIMRDIGK